MKSKNSRDWDLYGVLCFCKSAFEILVNGGKVDLNNVARELSKLRRIEKVVWLRVVNSCVKCNKPVKPGCGLRTKNGWRVHKKCASKKDWAE